MSTCVAVSDVPVSVDSHGVEYWWARYEEPVVFWPDGLDSPRFVAVPDEPNEVYFRADLP